MKVAKFVKSLMKFAEISTDKGVLYTENEFVVGAEVYVGDEEKVLAEDDEYVTDSQIIVVVDGKISEIKDKEEITTNEEPVVDEVELRKNKFNKIQSAFEESYEEKERKIIESIRNLGFNDSWLIEAGDDYAVIEAWNEENGNYKNIRFSISWDGENPIIGEFEEVKSEFVPVQENAPAVETEVVAFEEEEPVIEEPAIAEEPVIEEPKPDERDEKEERIENLENMVLGLQNEVENLKNIVNNIVQTPAATPIVEEFEQTKQVSKTNKAARLFSHLNS